MAKEMTSHEQALCTQPDCAVPARPPLLRAVFEEHASFVCRTLRRLGVSEADLDDLLQEVFVVVHKRLPEYRDMGRTRSWLYSICTRVSQAQRRNQKRRRESLVPEPPEEISAASQHQHMEDGEALVLGQRLLASLPAEQREIFVLYEVEDMTMPEIAEALGCPLQTAYSRLHSARQRILAEVNRLGAKERET
jgi:RNA polymerase sigma-70 factor (ECF subfamily)